MTSQWSHLRVGKHPEDGVNCEALVRHPVIRGVQAVMVASEVVRECTATQKKPLDL